MKRILALDMGSTTGWAALSAGEVSTGIHVCMKRTVAGDRWIRFHDWLSEMLDFYEPQTIIFEEPFIHMKHLSGIGVSYGFKTILEMLASRRRIRCYGIAPTVLKKWATGHGNASKDQMLTFARSMGWKMQDNNEVDARWLLEYARVRLAKFKGAA